MWFLSKLIYQIRCGEGRHTPQFDQQFRLIQAGSEAEAREKADRLGFEEADSFINSRQQPVRWEFIAVTELYPLDERIDGAEVCSRIEEADDAESYRSFVYRKAELLRQRVESSILVA